MVGGGVLIFACSECVRRFCCGVPLNLRSRARVYDACNGFKDVGRRLVGIAVGSDGLGVFLSVGDAVGLGLF